jgi:hypothetical protein
MGRSANQGRGGIEGMGQVGSAIKKKDFNSFLIFWLVFLNEIQKI